MEVEFCDVRTLHPVSQKWIGVAEIVVLPQGPDEEFPRRSKRIVIGNVSGGVSVIVTGLLFPKSTNRVSCAG
jgi:hypothetical protein